VARCWLDATRPGEVGLYFTDRRAERFLVRRITVSRPPDELDRETLSQIFELSLTALSEPGGASLDREGALRLLPTAPATEVEASQGADAGGPSTGSWGWGAQLGYRWVHHSAAVSWLQGPRVAPQLGWRGPKSALTLALPVQYELRETRTEPRLSLAFATWGVRLEPGYERWLGARWWWLLGLSAGRDWTQTRPKATGATSPYVPDAARWEGSWVLGGWTGVSLHASRYASLEAQFALELDPRRVVYKLETAEGDVTLLVRQRLRPVVVLGLAF